MRETLMSLALAASLPLSASGEVPAYLMLTGGAPAFTAENLLTADRAVNCQRAERLRPCNGPALCAGAR